MSRRFELLIFDWDGTLADSAATIVSSMQQAIAALELPRRSDAQIRELIGLGLVDVMERLYPGIDAQHLIGLLEAYRKRFVGHASGEAPLFAGALDTLRQLDVMGFRIAIATGKSRAGLRRALAHHGELARLVSSSRCADETASKPHPKMLHELLEEEQLGPEQALMIGDTEYDIAMARSAGLLGLGVACGVHAPSRIRAAGAAGVIDGVRDLPAWLAGS
ncbi:MAG: HAD-IA family hydrolase [Pseudomonadota bacterium]|nr:HAD-IA family hydrolase [Pseudomonadota bacterium]